jgi:hypothetical protein
VVAVCATREQHLSVMAVNKAAAVAQGDMCRVRARTFFHSKNKDDVYVSVIIWPDFLVLLTHTSLGAFLICVEFKVIVF